MQARPRLNFFNIMQGQQKTSSNKRFKKLVRYCISTLAIGVTLYAGLPAAVDYSLMEQKITKNYGKTGLYRLRDWQLLLQQITATPEHEKIAAINQFFNSQIAFQDDKDLWNSTDYWATPLETLGKGAGDCEDFTIAKYFTLLEAGIAVEKLRFIYVKAQIGDSSSRIFQAHMVLGYYETDTSVPYILDNLISSLEPATKRPDLKPVFSFNSQGLWVGNKSTNTDPTARLSRWRDLLQRTKTDGF